VSSGFGGEVGRGERKHLGIDIPAPRGTSVLAAAGGTVVAAEERGAYGNLVIVEHADGWSTRYAHLDRIGVTTGETVRTGAPIGDVGSTGVASGPHLHFEVWQGEDVRDPAPLIAGSQP
jgi:murein DD-endopeptidase MepM/ murein hydrolase activator NlpD